MRRSAGLALCAILGSNVLALAACASSTPTASLPASKTPTALTTQVASNRALTNDSLQSAMTAAANRATAVRVTSANPAGLKTVDMHFQLGTDGSCTESGTNIVNSVPITFEIIKSVVYVQLSPAEITSSGMFKSSGAPIASYVNKWVASTSSLGAQLSSFIKPVSRSVCLSSMAPAGVSYSPAGTSTIDAMAVAKYQGTDGSTLWIALAGPALPVRLTLSGTDGTYDFAWNQPLTITAPAASEILTAVPK